MGKKDQATVENRVYLFKDLAAAWLQGPGTSADRRATLEALADLAYASSVMANEDPVEAERLSGLIRGLAPE